MENCTKTEDPILTERCVYETRTIAEVIQNLYEYGQYSKIILLLFSSYVLVPLFVIGFFSNMMIVLIMSKQKRSSITFLFNALAVADTVFILTQTWDSFGGYKPVGYGVHYLWKATHSFTVLALRTSKKVSIYTVVLMTLERYLVICKPLKYGQAFTLRRTVIAVSVLGFIWLIFSFGTRWKDLWYYKLYCDICTGWVVNAVWEGYVVFIDYVTFDLNCFISIIDWVVEFLIPWPVLVTFNVLIIRALYKAAKTRKYLSNSSKSASGREKEVTLCLIIVVVLYFFLEIPRNSAHLILLILKVFPVNTYPYFGNSGAAWFLRDVMVWANSIGPA